MNKYEWIEAVMASSLSKATKVFAFGIFKHMNDGKSWPGDEALMDATGSGRGHFADYRKTLIEGDWIRAEPRKTQNGTSYTYYLPISLPPQGNQSATCGEQSATSGEQTATSGGMNTVVNTRKNTVMNTVEETTAPEAGPVVIETDVVREGLDSPSSSNCDSELYPLTEEGEVMNGTYWMKIKKVRPLTKEEKALENRQSAAYMKKQREKETPVLVGEPW